MPHIAVTPCRAMTDYLECLRRVGAETVELTVDTETPAAVLSRVDGVLFTGGVDVDPALYGETRHETVTEVDRARDDFEIALAREAVAAGIPIFAICRGMQVVNVALGGTLVQDIPSMVQGAVDHQVPEPRYALAHEVWMTKDSRLWMAMHDQTEESDTFQVNSRHHQAVARVAEGWDASATSPDGVIEAIERPGDPFCLAVQWHPENFWRTGEFRGLFETFVEAAGRK